MQHVSGWDHQPGRHCGSTALSNLASFYHWGFDEPTCFGLGTGIASVYTDHPTEPWRVFRGCGHWLEQSFFERMEAPHLLREGDGFDAAWSAVTSYLDDDDPVVLFLDPANLDHLQGDAHDPPHVAVAIGYDDEAATLSDGAVDDQVELPLDDLREAWASGWPDGHAHRHLVVTRSRTFVDEETAANRAVRETTTYMLEPRTVDFAVGPPGEHGLDALEAFAADVATWPDLPDPAAPARDALAGIVCHGEDAAFRGLYADALDDLAPQAGLGTGPADRLRRITDEWRTVRDLLADAVDADGDRQRDAALAEAGSILGDVADRERDLFAQIRRELRNR